MSQKKYAVVNKDGFIFETTETYDQALDFKKSLPEETEVFIREMLVEVEPTQGGLINE